jgi:hypothetical protein
MAFFGMSGTGKDAQTQFNNMGNWNQQQFQDWLKKANEQGDKGNFQYNWVDEYWKLAAGNGFPNPGQVRGTGQAISPYVQPTIDQMNKRNQALWEYWTRTVPKAGETMDQINANTDIMGANLTHNFTDLQNEIDSGYAGMSGRADAAHQETVNNIRESFGAAKSDWERAFNQLGERNAQGYNDSMTRTGTAYDAMGRNVEDYAGKVETLRPGGEFAAAQTGRAFAPALAASAGRLRRAGVDPNSVQAGAVLGDVEARRAMAMDDNMVEGQARYVDAYGNVTGARNNVLGGRLNTELGLRTNLDQTMTNLGREQAGGNRDMTLAEGSTFRDAVGNNLGIQNTLQGRRQDQSLNNLDTSFTRGQDLLGYRNQNAQLGRNMALGDLSTQFDLTRNSNNQDLTNIDLLNQQYGQGLTQEQLNQLQKNTAAGNIGNLMNTNYQQQQVAAQLAQKFGGDAAEIYRMIYGTEAANAGWGLKGLMGIGGAGLAAYLGKP